MFEMVIIVSFVTVDLKSSPLIITNFSFQIIYSSVLILRRIKFLLGFGKFHYMLLAVCGLIYMDTAIGVTILSFVLPAAQCDLEMDSTSKGWLTASPMLGELLQLL